MGSVPGSASELTVEYVSGDALRVRVRGHELVTDQPVDEGGEDLGPTPIELFVAGLASCIGYYAEQYLRRHDVSPDGLVVATTWHSSTDRPARVADIEVRIDVPAGVPERLRERFLRVVDHCTVHNSLRQQPEVRILLDGGADGGTGVRAAPLEVTGQAG